MKVAKSLTLWGSFPLSASRSMVFRSACHSVIASPAGQPGSEKGVSTITADL